MPPKVKKNPSKEDDSKKNKPKKNTPEDAESETNKEEIQQPISTNEVFRSNSEICKQEPVSSPEEAVQITYEEPVLTSIIVESYEGEKEKGLFEGYGKAIYKGGCVYEGEFHLGIMHGKGTYVWPNGIVYEGDFNNNEITGYGTYRWCSNIGDPSKWSTYRGQIYKGKRHGHGIFKSGNSSVVYDGEWNMGKRYGKGKMIYDYRGLSYYEGDWINNKKFGWGIRHYPSGNIYEGMWVNDVRHGEGTMKWFDKNQTYIGQWENGIQNGLGEHNWYLARVEMTQYSLRNSYYGNFKNGKRHGQGTYLYANGSKYEGNWQFDVKHGWGKYTYKDGRVYEGYFEDDKMTNSPTYNRKSILSKEINKIKVRIPSAGTTLNLDNIRNNQDSSRHEFSLSLDLSSLSEFFPIEKFEVEIVQAQKTIIRYLDLFKQIYRFYSRLGFDSSPDNTFVLNRMQFWRFLKDCKVHLNEHYLTLMDFDRLLNPKMNTDDLHCPYDKILLRDFFNHIVLIAYHLYHNQIDECSNVVSWCIEKMIVDNILPSSCNVQGYFYSDVRKTIYILPNMVKAYEIYKFLCSKRNKKPYDYSMTMRSFLNILNDLKILDGKLLTTKKVINILSSDNSVIFDSDNSFNLDLEMSFLEFFETLIGCALVYESKNISAKSRPVTSKNTIRSEREIFDNKSEINEKRLSIDDTKNGDANAEIEMEKPNDENLDEKTNLEIIENTDFQKQSKEDEYSDFENWNEKNNYFFNQIFFPGADKYNEITRLVNISL